MEFSYEGRLLKKVINVEGFFMEEVKKWIQSPGKSFTLSGNYDEN